MLILPPPSRPLRLCVKVHLRLESHGIARKSETMDTMRALLAIVVVLLCAGLAPASQADAAKEVLRRTIGARADAFVLRLVPARPDGLDAFAVEASRTTVRVEGTSGVALVRGAYEYLKRACGVQVTWDQPQPTLPRVLPDFPRTEVVCPNALRHYFNVCTFGYTTAYWDWKRWEREIDWMALHGINMPLAMTGQERVWQTVWRGYGLTDDQIRSFFSGSAFLPWHRMGNINSHGGPLPQTWLDGQAELQKKILARERELGMTPVTPAFSGFLPPDFVKARPEAKTMKSAAWAGFEPTVLLHPADPLFPQIGKKFLDEYRKTFGEGDHLYLADVFNEMTPQVSEDTKLADLKAVGEAVYRSIEGADPNGVWVMMGWLFLNEKSFWGVPETAAFLSGVPDDRMIVIDLAVDLMEVWRAHESVRKKRWIACILHNFGGATPLFGNLKLYSEVPIKALNDPNHGRMAGMGITPEGIEQNPVVYELVADTMWRREPVDLRAWLNDYCLQRYGAVPLQMRVVWDLLLEGPYKSGGAGASYQNRPSIDSIGEPGPDFEASRTILEQFLACAAALGGSDAYRRDLVDVSKRYLQGVGGVLAYRALLASADKGPEFQRAKAAHLELLDDVNRLLSTRSEYRLAQWLLPARVWGGDRAESDLHERNARMQVTVWGGPILHDYAAKEWAGLVSGFYRERWSMLWDDLGAEGTFDPARTAKRIADWEWEWTQRTDRPRTVGARDEVEIAVELLAKYRSVAQMPVDRGLAFGKPVTGSAGVEGTSVPSFVTDGYASGRYWGANPSPQWVQIDLEKPASLARIDLYAYFDGSRYYQYTVDVSADGQAWTRVVDGSGNTLIATARGYHHEFAPVTARYVKVTMLKNSANIGVHLYEVRVFGPGARNGSAVRFGG